MTEQRLPISGLSRGLVAGLLVLSYLAAGYWPFVWDPPRTLSNAARRDAEGSLLFDGVGLAVTRSPPPWIAPVREGASLRIEVEARSARPDQTGPARILTLSRDVHRRNLSLGQDGGDLVVRFRRPGSTPNGEPAYRVPGLWGDGLSHRIRLLRSGGELKIEVDGVTIVAAPLHEGALSNWDPECRLALGNEVSGDRPWSGEIRTAKVTTGGGVFDYLKPGAVEMPPGIPYVPQRLAGRLDVAGFFRTTVGDAALNLAGFLPLGLLLGLAGTRARRILLLAAMLSVSLEAGQIAFDERIPSLADVLLNVAGAGAGVLLLARFRSPRTPARS